MSFANHFITSGLSAHAVQTPDASHDSPLHASSSSSNLTSYFSLSRNPSSARRRPSVSEAQQPPATATASTPFNLKLPTRQNTAGSANISMFTPGSRPPLSVPPTVPPPSSPAALYTSITELCAKRLATLDYLRRAHEGRVFWFNCHLIPRSELSRTVYPMSESRKLQRRAAQYFVLGNSLPTVLEISGATEFMKAWMTVLSEYEGFCSQGGGRRGHAGSVGAPPATGTAGLRGLGKLLGRSTHRRGSDAVVERARSGSSAGMHPVEVTILDAGGGTAQAEDYVYLNAPLLPFEVDYFEVFATLCDTLLEVYRKVLEVVEAPQNCGPQLAEMFMKADQKVKRLVVGSVVREWEDAVRGGVKREVAGVGREVLAGMM